MTVLEVKNQMVTHFLKHDTFDPVKHAFDITYDKDTADFREQLCSIALGELEQAGFVRRLNQPEKSIWVLTQPIASHVQQVAISPIIADMLASVVNFHNELDEIDYVVDSTKIDEGVIARLINIVSDQDDIMMEQEKAAHGQGDEEERK
jgi:hypothetical protein